jgi:hypothetical protein
VTQRYARLRGEMLTKMLTTAVTAEP